MEDKLVKVNQDIRCLDDFNELCLERIRRKLFSELQEREYTCMKLWDMLSEGLDNILWKNRMTSAEVRLYDDFHEFNFKELDHTDIQCGALTKVRQYVGVTNVKTTDKLSFKDTGVIRQVLFGNEHAVCAVLYRQVDTSDIIPHRDVLAIYTPRDFRHLKVKPATHVEESIISNIEDLESKDEINDVNKDDKLYSGKIGKFTRVYTE